MSNPFSLQGKNILVTGASSGIGRQTAICCAEAGATIVAVARSSDRLDETLCLLPNGRHRRYCYDLADTDGIGGLISRVVAEVGKLDGLVCAAGIEKTLPVKLLKPSDYDEVMRVNTLSAFEMARHVTSLKNFGKVGGVVFVSSITSVIARSGTAAYSASKGALVSGARVMAAELARRRIRVNCVSPGTVITPMMQSYLAGLTEEQYNNRIGGFPLGLGEPADVALACVYLLSDAARWVTGQNLIIDGGFTMQ